ncbi:2674_t:CDS:2, partial [Dentiscutata erythropus]
LHITNTMEPVILSAKKFAGLLGIPNADFKASQGWVDRFKKRNDLQKYKFHRESESVPVENLPNQRQKLVELLLQYNPEDVYNVDETGLYYRMMPNQTLATKLVKGQKKVKDRITILFCINATSMDKLKLLVIKPHCFIGIRQENLGIKYAASKNAWMTGSIFEYWINSLNATCRLKKKNILLLVDGAKYYSNCELTNINLYFLLPNTTPYLQPCDAGLIHSFKAHYSFEIKEVVLDEAAIIEEVLYQSDSGSSDEEKQQEPGNL